MTAVALLQCVERDLIELDSPLSQILPELEGHRIVKRDPNTGDLCYEPSKTPITARHLLTHTSGMGYYFLDPSLAEWKASPEGRRREVSGLVTEKYDQSLIFEPGTGWVYGVSPDLAAVVVRRLYNNQSLEEYMTANLWKPLGLSHPFPTFNIEGSSEKPRLMQTAR